MTDHVKEAQKYISDLETLAGQHLELDMALAQTHATLALVEQQKRIADWLENWPLGSRGEPMTGGWND